ncbi:hypothetical protein EU803_12885 [Loktanella sp. IMCC34160]|uniref:hypothetical protein n=1 Tax=Loktanella sp. IMCC34160 TaxID=2510646 RepID=UPI00101B9E0A|nr:hypothetical protein [Loktanella sp. IMCC34160]RYG90879.1 hypothetical protein EU803_12885 [Loktanella sp. IMCC34160]
MLRLRGNAVLEHWLARIVIRFAWHLTSLTWVMIAILLLTVGTVRVDPTMAILGIFGVGFLVAGVFDMFISRGQHIGWPLLAATGTCLLAARSVAPPIYVVFY